jgi:hypothetical protein
MSTRAKIMQLLEQLRAAGVSNHATRAAEQWLVVGTRYSNEDFDRLQALISSMPRE